LGIESSPPLFRSETTTSLVLDGDTARTDASIEVQQVRGRLFDIDVAVPPGLLLASIGPPDLVESVTPATGTDLAGKEALSSARAHVLRVHLTAAGRDQRLFTLRLRGQERIGRQGDVEFGLFSPRWGVSSSSTVSLYADPDVSFEAVDKPDRPN